jgi:AcrR family transcriptional regulator
MKAIDNVKVILLNTAKEVIRTEGLADFNIRAIANKAGVSIGTVYNYYPSKSDLVFETMETLLTECVSCIKDQSSEDLYQEFRDVYNAILNYFDLFQGDIMDDLATLASSKDKPRAVVQHSHMMIFKESFSHILFRHKAEINPEVFDKFGVNRVIEMILTLFTSYLRKGEKNFDLIEYVLRKMLGR